MSVTAEQAKRFAAIFAGRETCWGQMSLVNGKKSVGTKHTPLPPDAYLKHLLGEGPFLGIVPINESNECFFGAIDVDDDGIDLHELEAKVVAHQLPVVVCRSKSGGAHLYCFSIEAVSAKMMVDALKAFRKTLGHEKNASGKAVEIFPKQVKLAPTEDGSWINLPYYDHENTNRYAVTGGRQLALAEFFDLVVARAVNEKQLAGFIDPDMGPFGDGPICLQEMHKEGAFSSGSRNGGLFNVGIYYRISQPDTWQDEVRHYNETYLDEPLDAREMAGVIASIERHDKYNYTCNQHPIEGFCKKSPCKKQQFGIGYFHKQYKVSLMPVLSNLVRINTDPPRFRLKVGDKDVEITSEQLISPIAFKKAVFEKLTKVIPNFKQEEWDDIVRELSAETKEEAAPMEASDSGLLILLLTDFLQGRMKSDSLDDVLLGRPARGDDGRVYFRAQDFYKFLQDRRFSKFDTNETYSILERSCGLMQSQKPLRGGNFSLFSVPEPKDEQSEPFAYPAAKPGSQPY